MLFALWSCDTKAAAQRLGLHLHTKAEMGWVTYPLLRSSTGDLGVVISCRFVVGDGENFGRISTVANIRAVCEELAISEKNRKYLGHV